MITTTRYRASPVEAAAEASEAADNTAVTEAAATKGSGFLRQLEHREDLELLCVRLVSDAVRAKRLAERHEGAGDRMDAARCRAAARGAARMALRLLWVYRMTPDPVSERERFRS
jgi:hypothetical protein